MRCEPGARHSILQLFGSQRVVSTLEPRETGDDDPRTDQVQETRAPSVLRNRLVTREVKEALVFFPPRGERDW